ncbi:MAG: DUF1439 domain-containing protein [Pseudomonadota bacterium]
MHVRHLCWTQARLAASLWIVLALASCATLIGPRQVELPLSRLQQNLERRFPLNKRVLELFDISLTHPQLRLLPDSGRVALALEAQAGPAHAWQSWHPTQARLLLSGRLKLDKARDVVALADLRVDSITLEGDDEAARGQLNKVVNVLIDTLVRDLPVYTLRADDLRYAGVQFVPTAIETRQNALLVTLEPLR